MTSSSLRLRAGQSVAFAIAIFLHASVAATPSRAAHAPPTLRLISANATNPAIDDVIGIHHVAIGPSEERLGRLLVFLPGTGAPPQLYSQIIESTTRQGYHTIGLAYVNPDAVNVLCAGMGAVGCHESVRREIILGTDESPLVDVDFDNSIVNRLDQLLAHLESIAPSEGWGAFRDPMGQIRWESIVIAGHSQGAGHAAFIARLERVARAVLFSGTEPAPWTQAGDFQTPATDIWAFGHLLETFFDAFQSSWDNIGIPGVPVSVDGVLPPLGPGQQLSTSNSDCTGDPGSNGFYHNCHVADGWMPPPSPDGTPFFEYAWIELFRLESTPPVPPVPTIDETGLGLLLLGLACFGILANDCHSQIHRPTTPMRQSAKGQRANAPTLGRHRSVMPSVSDSAPPVATSPAISIAWTYDRSTNDRSSQKGPESAYVSKRGCPGVEARVPHPAQSREGGRWTDRSSSLPRPPRIP